jgi:hypothetical protein
MPRTSFVRSAAVALALFFSARSAHAQVVTTPAPADSDIVVPARPDSLPPTVLHTVTIKAESGKASRAGVLALMEENRHLAQELAGYDRKVSKLETRLAYLKGPVTDSLNRQITGLDAATAETRARRLELEARLNALEGTSTAVNTP